jgi:three-Cys-motif partner protein
MVMSFDEIGSWSEVKLEIVRDYAVAYSRILDAQKDPVLHHAYIDAFAGSGVSLSRTTGKFVAGSPLNALSVSPRFKEFYLIDLDSDKTDTLHMLVGNDPSVHIYKGDCNSILLDEVFPRVRYEDYRRALCLLDPYGLHLNWEVIQAAADVKSVEMFLNFPVEDMNRNVLWKNPDRVPPKQVERLTAFWGDESWRNIAYDTQGNLFGWKMKQPNEVIASAFCERLRKVAGFAHVPQPIPMRNSANAIVYYLFFACHKPVAANIVKSIFEKHRKRDA